MKGARFTEPPFLLIRACLLPWDPWVACCAELRKEPALRPTRTQALAAWLQDPLSLPSLSLSSPSLAAALSGADSGSVCGHGDVEASAFAFFSRATTRATPFGLFASLSVAHFAPRGSGSLLPRAALKTQSRLDAKAVMGALRIARSLPGWDEAAPVAPNPSLSQDAGELSFWSVAATEAWRERCFNQVFLSATPAIERCITLARGGLTLPALAQRLAEPEDDPAEVRAFVEELHALGVLVDTWEIPLLAGRADRAIARRIATLPAAQEMPQQLLQQLDGCLRELEALDAGPIDRLPELLPRIEDRVAAMLGEPLPQRPFVQIDAVRPTADLRLPRTVFDEIAAGAALLSEIGPEHHAREWTALRAEFKERFGEAEVPLLKLFNPSGRGVEFGRGRWSSPETTRAIRLPGSPAETERWTEWDRRLLKKVLPVLRAGAAGTELGAEDLDELRALREPASFPPAAMLGVKLFAAGMEELNRGEFRFRIGSADHLARFLGRHASDPHLGPLIRDALRLEESLEPGVIFADLVHLPAGERMANVVQQPALRGHHIPYLGTAGAEGSQEIPVADLTVRLVGRRFMLRSQRLGRDVLPVLANMHAHFGDRSLPVYRFLAGLAFQGAYSGLPWVWRGVWADFPHLPRISVGRHILAPAQWVMSASDRARIAADPHWPRELHRWWEEQRLPESVQVRQWTGDFRVERSIPWSLQVLRRTMRIENLRLFFTEAPDLSAATDRAEAGWLSSPDGRHEGELLVPLFRRGESEQTAARGQAAVSLRHLPGSAWSFAKLYGPPALMDRWLCEDLGDWLDHRLGAREIAPGEETRPWFFLRYQDPHWHLRIRYYEEDAATRGWLRSELERLASSLPGLRTLTWDTYEPELDRYGGEQGTALSERIFDIDSRVALSRRRFFAREVDAWERLYASIAGLRALLDGLDLPLSTQLDLLSRMRGSFLSEHAADKATRADLSAEYRRRQAPIERAAAPPSVAAREAELSQLATLRPLAARFRELHQAGAIHRSLEEVAPSFVHMHMNRWFESEQRRQEMISYEFAWRAVRSLLARQKASP